jgi:hypothetical protein
MSELDSDIKRQFALRTLSMRRASIAGVQVAALAMTRTVAACPDCAEGMLARQAVLQEHLSRNFACAVLPFLIIGAICAGVERMGRRGP